MVLESLVSGVVWTRMAVSTGMTGCGLGMFQLSGSFTVLFRCANEDNDQDPFRLMSSWNYNRVILGDFIGIEELRDFNAAFHGIS